MPVLTNWLIQIIPVNGFVALTTDKGKKIDDMDRRTMLSTLL